MSESGTTDFLVLAAILDYTQAVRMIPKQIKTIACKSMAGFMAVWLSGVVFLFCCETIGANTVDGDFHASAEISAHCETDQPETTEADFADKTETDCADCCAFLPLVFDKNRKIDRTEKQSAATPKLAALKFKIPRLVATPNFAIAFHTRLFDNQSSFIKNRVFRI